MSYILEALKKSDKERQKEEVPGLETDHAILTSRRERHRGFVWLVPVGVAAICGIGAGGLLWWFSVEQPAVVSDVEVIAVSAVSGQDSSSIVGSSAQVEATLSDNTAKIIQPVSGIEEPIKPQPAIQEPLAMVETVQLSPSVESESVFVPPLLEDLPVSVRAGIPDLDFAGHVYSYDPSKRLIIINNRIVRQGDSVSNGLVLQRIDPEGVVLRYETSVFRVKLF